MIIGEYQEAFLDQAALHFGSRNFADFDACLLKLEALGPDYKATLDQAKAKYKIELEKLVAANNAL